MREDVGVTVPKPPEKRRRSESRVLAGAQASSKLLWWTVSRARNIETSCTNPVHRVLCWSLTLFKKTLPSKMVWRRDLWDLTRSTNSEGDISTMLNCKQSGVFWIVREDAKLRPRLITTRPFNVTRYNTAILFSTSIFSWEVNISIFQAKMLTARHMHGRHWKVTGNCLSVVVCGPLGSGRQTLTWTSCGSPLSSCTACTWLHSNSVKRSRQRYCLFTTAASVWSVSNAVRIISKKTAQPW